MRHARSLGSARLALLLLAAGLPASDAAAQSTPFSILPSRCATASESCPAPLAVMFETTISDPDFVQWHCEWDFGDGDSVSGGSATWKYTVAPPPWNEKNRAIGPIAQHVYEYNDGQSGEIPYTVTLSCWDETGADQGTATATLYVDDPAAVWSGTKTICISASGSFTGCPEGAEKVTSSDFDAATSAHLAAGRRILLRRGEVFTADDRVSLFDLDGPGMIGAYDSGAKPLIHRIEPGPSLIRFSGTHDWRIADLDLAGPGGVTKPNRGICANAGCGATAASDDMLFLRVDNNGFHTPFLLTLDVIRDSRIFLVGPATLSNVGGLALNGNPIFLGAIESALIDHDVSGGVHVVRWMCIQNSLIQHNWTHSAWDGLNVRGCSSTLGPGVNFRVVVSDNQFDLPLRVPGGQNNLNMQVHYLLFERNVMNGITNQTEPYSSMYRNNVCIRSSDSCFQIRNVNALTPPPHDTKFFNNSFYNPTGNQPAIYFVNTQGPGHECKNNIVYAPTSGTALACQDSSSGVPDIADNWNDASPTSPYVAPSPASLSDFQLACPTAGVAACAVALPPLLPSDAGGRCRDTPGDWGAWEQPGAPCS